MTSFSHLLRSAPYYSPAKYTTPGQTQRQERRLHATQRPLINPYATLTADDFDTFVDDVSNRIAGALSYDREAELASKRRGYAGDDEYWLELGGKPGEFLGGTAAAPEQEEEHQQQQQLIQQDDLAAERFDRRAQSAQPFPAGDPASHRSVTVVSNGDDAEGEAKEGAALDGDTSMLGEQSQVDEDSAEAELEEDEADDLEEDEQLDEDEEDEDENEDELEEEDSGAEQDTLQTRQPTSRQVEPITLDDDTTDEDEDEGEAEDDEEEEDEKGQEEYDEGDDGEEHDDEDDDPEANEDVHEPAQPQQRWRPAQVLPNANVCVETDDGQLLMLRDEQEDARGEQEEAEEQDYEDDTSEAGASQGEAETPLTVFADSNLAFETADGNVVTLQPPPATISSAPTSFPPTSSVYPDLSYLQDLPPQPVQQSLYPSLDGLANAGFGFIPASTLPRQADVPSPFASQPGTELQQSLDVNTNAAADADPDMSYDMGALPELNGEGDDIMPIDLLLDAANEDVERVQEAVEKVAEADAEEEQLNAELLELVHQQQQEPSLQSEERSDMLDSVAAHGQALADDLEADSGEEEIVEEDEEDADRVDQQERRSPAGQQRRSQSKQESDVISIGSSSEEEETEAPTAPRRPTAAQQSQASQQYARKTLPPTAVPAPIPSQARLMSRRVLDQLDEEDREASGYTSDGEGPAGESHLFGQEEGDADAEAAAAEENEDDPDAREFRRMQQGVRRRRAVEEEQDAEDAYFGEESEGDHEEDSAEDEDEDGDAQGSEDEGSSSSADATGAGAQQQKRHRPTSTRDEFADEVDDQELDEQEERAKRFKTDADIEDRVPIPRFMKKDSSGEYVLDYSGGEAEDDEEEEEDEDEEDEEAAEDEDDEEGAESNDEGEVEHGDNAAGQVEEEDSEHADATAAVEDGGVVEQKSVTDDVAPAVASASLANEPAQTAPVELEGNREEDREAVAAADTGATEEYLAESGEADNGEHLSHNDVDEQDTAGAGAQSPSGGMLEEILHTFETDPQGDAVVTTSSISSSVSTAITIHTNSTFLDNGKQEPMELDAAPEVIDTDADSAEQPPEPPVKAADEAMDADPIAESTDMQTAHDTAAAPDTPSEATAAARTKSATPVPEQREADMVSGAQPLSPITPSTKAAKSASHAPFLPQSLIIPPQEASSSVVSAISQLPAAATQLGIAPEVADASSPALVSPIPPASQYLPPLDLSTGEPESYSAIDEKAEAEPELVNTPETHDAGAEQPDARLDATAASLDSAAANAPSDGGQSMEVDTIGPEADNAPIQDEVSDKAAGTRDLPAREPSAEADQGESTSNIPPYTTETDASFDAGSLFPSTAPLYTAETDVSFDERSLFPGVADPDASFDAASLLASAVAAPTREDSLPPAPTLSRRESGQPANGQSGTPTRILNAIQPGLWKPGTPIRFGGRSLQAAVREAAYDPERSRTLEESLAGRKTEEVSTAESPEETLEAPDPDFIAIGGDDQTTDTADAAADASLAPQADLQTGDSTSADAIAPAQSGDVSNAMSPMRRDSQELESMTSPSMPEAQNDKNVGGPSSIPVEEYTDAVPDYLSAASTSGSEQEQSASEAVDQEEGDDEEEADALVAILLSPKGKTFITSGTAPVANRASVRRKGKGRRSQTPEASVRASPRGRSQARRGSRSSSDSAPVERRRSSRSRSRVALGEEEKDPRLADQAAAGGEEEDESDIKEVVASRSPAKVTIAAVAATGAGSTPIKRRSVSQSQRVLLPSTPEHAVPEHAVPALGDATEEALEDMEVVSLLTTKPSRPRLHKHGESHLEAAQRRREAASATERTSGQGGMPSHEITTGQSPAVVHPKMERDDHKHGLTSSPITTRSHCTYHKLSIPNPLLRDSHRASGADTPLRRMSTRLARAHEGAGAPGNYPSHYVFLVPGCCVTRDLIDKEGTGNGRGMEDLGVAINDEEGNAIRILSVDEGGDGEKLTVTGIPDEVIQSLIRVVGLELFRDGDCEILEPVATRSTEGQVKSKAAPLSAAPADPLPPQSERKRRRESDMGGMTGTPHKRAK